VAVLALTSLGSGPPVLFVHGSIVGPERTWRHQLSLGERWNLRLLFRPGFGASPPLVRGDFESEAPLVAEALGAGAHLVGHSYGAVIALYAAGLRPDAVHSLTVSEPGCLGVASGEPVVDAAIEHGKMLYGSATAMTPREFLLAFRGGVGSSHETPPELDAELLLGTALLMRERPPWEAQPPLQSLARAPFRRLVISGGHSPVFEAVCDTLAERIGAERDIIAGRGHTVPATGAAYNQRLERFLSGA
jgi:pimeloyl-ACP methyl ester carboxylesterase